MERESNPMEALCRSGCGFYGNPSTDGLCSVCFKEALKKKQQPPATTPSPVSTSFVAATPLAAATPTVPALPVQPQLHTDVRNWKRRVGPAPAAQAPVRQTLTLTTRTVKTKRKRTDAQFAARRLDSQGSSAAAGVYSARCTDTATSTSARSTTGSSARRRYAATTPSSCRRRYTKYEPAPPLPRYVRDRQRPAYIVHLVNIPPE